MLVGGWADGYRNNTFRTAAAPRGAGTPHRLLLQPWSHMSTATSLPGARSAGSDRPATGSTSDDAEQSTVRVTGRGGATVLGQSVSATDSRSECPGAASQLIASSSTKGQVVDRDDDPAHGEPWSVARDVLGDRTVCSVGRGAEGTSELATTVERKTFVQRADATADFTVRWEHATVRARAELRLDAGPSAFDVQLGVETWCDGVPFASRRWKRSIARDLG